MEYTLLSQTKEIKVVGFDDFVNVLLNGENRNYNLASLRYCPEESCFKVSGVLTYGFHNTYIYKIDKDDLFEETKEVYESLIYRMKQGIRADIITKLNNIKEDFTWVDYLDHIEIYDNEKGE